MAVPKYRPSSHRQGRRRSQHHVKLPETSECPHCGALKRPHFACPSCGKLSKNKTKKKDDKTKKSKKEKGSKT